jgi:hypothetical protein
MNKKFQVFVSSTFRDLAEERQDAIRTILDLGHIPAGMELFPASDTEQLAYIKKVINECDYYLLIMGGRYGSLDEDGVSYTEREYDYAVETGKTVIAFPHGDPANLTVAKSDVAPRMVENLASFRAKVMAGRLVKEWTSRSQLDTLVTKSLVRAISDYPAVGWIRGDTAASEELLAQSNSLRQQNDELMAENRALKQVAKPHIEGLADMSETIQMRFTHTAGTGSHRYKKETTATLSWKQIFIAVGSEIAAPKSVQTISGSISKYLQENHGITYTASMLDADETIIKNQLVSLGLIRAYVGTAIGTGAAHEFMQITEAGKTKLAEFLAVRSGSAAQPPALSK